MLCIPCGTVQRSAVPPDITLSLVQDERARFVIVDKASSVKIYECIHMPSNHSENRVTEFNISRCLHTFIYLHSIIVSMFNCEIIVVVVVVVPV